MKAGERTVRGSACEVETLTRDEEGETGSADLVLPHMALDQTRLHMSIENSAFRL